MNPEAQKADSPIMAELKQEHQFATFDWVASPMSEDCMMHKITLKKAPDNIEKEIQQELDTMLYMILFTTELDQAKNVCVLLDCTRLTQGVAGELAKLKSGALKDKHSERLHRFAIVTTNAALRKAADWATPKSAKHQTQFFDTDNAALTWLLQ